MVAALYVEPGGCYFGLPNVDPWDIDRDARQYAGPHPVVAHPPCDRWHQLSAVNNRRWGYVINDDGGCFAAALAMDRAKEQATEHNAEIIIVECRPIHLVKRSPVRAIAIKPRKGKA